MADDTRHKLVEVIITATVPQETWDGGDDVLEKLICLVGIIVDGDALCDALNDEIAGVPALACHGVKIEITEG